MCRRVTVWPDKAIWSVHARWRPGNICQTIVAVLEPQLNWYTRPPLTSHLRPIRYGVLLYLLSPSTSRTQSTHTHTHTHHSLWIWVTWSNRDQNKCETNRVASTTWLEPELVFSLSREWIPWAAADITPPDPWHPLSTLHCYSSILSVKILGLYNTRCVSKAQLTFKCPPG